MLQCYLPSPQASCFSAMLPVFEPSVSLRSTRARDHDRRSCGTLVIGLHWQLRMYALWRAIAPENGIHSPAMRPAARSTRRHTRAGVGDDRGGRARGPAPTTFRSARARALCGHSGRVVMGGSLACWACV